MSGPPPESRRIRAASMTPVRYSGLCGPGHRGCIKPLGSTHTPISRASRYLEIQPYQLAAACATLLAMEGYRDPRDSREAVPVTGTADAGAAGHGGLRDPVFLVAPARSYSTVSIALLAGHPELYGLPETSLFLRESVGEILAMPAGQSAARAGRRHSLMGLERAIAQLHDGSQDDAAL